jgi:soluble lytic murein transglycosylase-like protein
LNKLIFLLLLIFCLGFTGLAGADFYPQALPTPVSSVSSSPVVPKIRSFDAALPKAPVIARPGKKESSDPWPEKPPQIGRLVLKQEYWNYMKEAARKYQLSPYLIQAVCAIESRYIPTASSVQGQCYGLMQLHRDTARKYGVNARDPRENILGGAAVLANLLNKYNGNLSRVLHVYNATCTSAYEREVKKAFNQAMRNGQSFQQVSYHQ